MEHDSTEAIAGIDADRVVDLNEDGDAEPIVSRPVSVDDRPVLPRSSRDDTDAGWGERPADNDDRLREERPPHWD